MNSCRQIPKVIELVASRQQLFDKRFHVKCDFSNNVGEIKRLVLPRDNPLPTCLLTVSATFPQANFY